MYKKIILFALLFNASIFAKSNEFLLLNSAPYSPGFFSALTTVIDLLDQYDKEDYAGIKIDFTDQGLYYDQEQGLNWWNYYFEPINFRKTNRFQLINFQAEDHVHFALQTIHHLSSDRIYQLIKKYIHVKKSIRKEVHRFKRKNFKDFVIGIHFRGTDKKCESPRIAYEILSTAVINKIEELKIKKFTIFVATDETDFLNYIENLFPGSIVYTNSLRSSDGHPIHVRAGDNYQKGKEALIDCLLLSKCDYLIRTSSNLSLCATYFNPELPVILLNPGAYDRPQ